MSTNISKQKRQDLLNKIKEIRNYIAAAPQDKNTGNLLSYLSDLNTDSFVKCRKLYMGHDLLPDEDQEQSLAKHGIEVNIIPDCYYQDLQEK